MKFFLYSSILLVLLLSHLSKKSWATENQFHVVDLTGHLSASVCEATTTNYGFRNGQTTLDVFHSQGPCAQEILQRDTKAAAGLPVHTSSSKSNDYVVAIGLGTPSKKVSLLLDTTTNLVWTQCPPCILNCYKQREPLFNSTTYSAICCQSPECSLLKRESEYGPSCSPNGNCVYALQYWDYSLSVGFLGRDKLTLAGNQVFLNFVFGCSQFSDNFILGLEAGYLGLAGGQLSLVSQTASQQFSYCLPSRPSVKGYLTLGKGFGVNSKNRLKFTPLVTNPESNSSYFINIVSIAVGGVKLQMSPEVFSGDVMIDTASRITQLPLDAYKLVSQEFKRQINTYGYKRAPYELFDTCFSPPNNTKVRVPAVSFTFQKNVTVDIHPTGILYVVNSTVVCLAFQAGSQAILGNYLQKTLEVVYDVAGRRVGLRQNGCA